MDPISKLVLMSCVSVLVLTVWDLYLSLAIYATIVLMILLARVPASNFLRVQMLPLSLTVAAIACYGFVVPGETVLFAVGPIRFVAEGVILALKIAMRFFNLISMAFLLIATTDPRDLASVFSRVSPTLGLSTSLALRFIPLYETQARIITDAHKVRDVGRKRSIMRKVGEFRHFAIPMLAGGIKRATMTAIAMDSRGFGVYRQRTSMRPLVFPLRGKLLSIMIIVLFSFLIWRSYTTWNLLELAKFPWPKIG
jgi:energy-coupling factor transport system permease protein